MNREDMAGMTTARAAQLAWRSAELAVARASDAWASADYAGTGAGTDAARRAAREAAKAGTEATCAVAGPANPPPASAQGDGSSDLGWLALAVSGMRTARRGEIAADAAAFRAAQAAIDAHTADEI